MVSLGQRKAKFENEMRSGRRPEELSQDSSWTSADGRALEEETAKARQGLAFLYVKIEG